jgi:hypothetical protein
MCDDTIINNKENKSIHQAVIKTKICKDQHIYYVIDADNSSTDFGSVVIWVINW